MKACLTLTFLSGIVQVLGSAFIAGFVGMAQYGGYLGMWDWATVWPVLTVLIKYLGWIGLTIGVVALLALPQLEYRKDPKGYFLMTENWDEYKKYKGIETESCDDDYDWDAVPVDGEEDLNWSQEA